MGRFQIRVVIDRPLADVFAVYLDCDNWRWCSIIRSARWVRGKPWEVESRMQIHSSGHMPATVDQVLMHFEPRRRVDYISHFSGMTLETRVMFRALSDHETEIEGHMESVGTFSRIIGIAVDPMIERSTRQFFEDLKRHCEQVIPPRAISGSVNADPSRAQGENLSS